MSARLDSETCSITLTDQFQLPALLSQQISLVLLVPIGMAQLVWLVITHFVGLAQVQFKPTALHAKMELLTMEILIVQGLVILLLGQSPPTAFLIYVRRPAQQLISFGFTTRAVQQPVILPSLRQTTRMGSKSVQTLAIIMIRIVHMLGSICIQTKLVFPLALRPWK